MYHAGMFNVDAMEGSMQGVSRGTFEGAWRSEGSSARSSVIARDGRARGGVRVRSLVRDLAVAACGIVVGLVLGGGLVITFIAVVSAVLS